MIPKELKLKGICFSQLPLLNLLLSIFVDEPPKKQQLDVGI
jgi:hypothetical protein